MLKIGVDTGGTFTDFVAFDGRRIRILKLLSTPAHPAEAILRGLDELLAAAPGGRPGAPIADESRAVPQLHPAIAGRALRAVPLEVIHGSTVATNALLERKGAKTALITTRGFEDVLEIGRQNRPKIYSLFPSRPAPLVPANLRFGLTERVLHDGSVLVPLRRSELRAVAARLRRRNIESLAVCLLFAYANPAHEKAVARAVAGLAIPVSLSHVILPEYREYERTSTTVVNAYLAPVMGRYLADLLKKLGSAGGRALRIMQSNGGSVSARVAIREPVRTILSGPAGGVVGAWHVARLAGLRRILTFDMGGTSTDVALCDGGIRVINESVIANNPIGVPVIDIHTVGAGGGSIARVDQGGALRVGPESAGADPGPICYGRGDRVTVTDANLLLGRLDVSYPLGGSLRLEAGRINEAFGRLARQIGAPDPIAAAEGVIAVANANMEAALRVISVERGHDPRDFTLVTFGGAGGLHAVELANSLSIPLVLVPANPGLLSALGVLLADTVRDFSRTVILQTNKVETQSLERHFALLEATASAAMRREGFEGARVRLERWLDMRYRGQSYELSLPYSESFPARFHRRHEQRYGYADPQRETEIVTLRVRGRGSVPKPALARQPLGPQNPRRALIGEKQVRFGGRLVPTRLYEREVLSAGNRIRGPALIFEYSASTAIPPGHSCRVDRYLNLLVARDGGGS